MRHSGLLPDRPRHRSNATGSSKCCGQQGHASHHTARRGAARRWGGSQRAQPARRGHGPQARRCSTHVWPSSTVSTHQVVEEGLYLGRIRQQLTVGVLGGALRRRRCRRHAHRCVHLGEATAGPHPRLCCVGWSVRRAPAVWHTRPASLAGLDPAPLGMPHALGATLPHTFSNQSTRVRTSGCVPPPPRWGYHSLHCRRQGPLSQPVPGIPYACPPPSIPGGELHIQCICVVTRAYCLLRPGALCWLLTTCVYKFPQAGPQQPSGCVRHPCTGGGLSLVPP